MNGNLMMYLISTHPLVRRSFTCVCCGGSKDQELLLCWPCHHAEKLKNSGAYSASTEYRLDCAEHDLMREGAPT